MEMTYEQWKEAKKGIRRHLSSSGWALLIYYAIMNLAVIGYMLAETFAQLFDGLIAGDSASIENAVNQSA